MFLFDKDQILSSAVSRDSRRFSLVESLLSCYLAYNVKENFEEKLLSENLFLRKRINRQLCRKVSCTVSEKILRKLNFNPVNV